MKSLAFVCLSIAGLLIFGTGAPVAVAAPQVLALVPTDQAIPLHCDGQTCSTRVSTFCLQRWRPSPEAGVRYVATGGEGLRLIGIGTDGAIRPLGHDLNASIIATFGSSAVEIEVSQKSLAAAGVEHAMLRVGDGVSLVPVALPGDANPQSDQDIALATGPLRDAADFILRRNGESIAVASLVNRTIGLVPNPYSNQTQGPIDVRSEIFRSLPSDEAREGVRGTLDDIFDRCEVGTAGQESKFRDLLTRECLGRQHDKLITPIRESVWKAIETGS